MSIHAGTTRPDRAAHQEERPDPSSRRAATEHSASSAVPATRSRPIWQRAARRLIVGTGIFASLVLVWWAIAFAGSYPPYILPTPLAVAEKMWAMLLEGSLQIHWWTTALEAGLGFGFALVFGLCLGYAIARSRLAERLASPYLGISQGLPVVALAPLLFIWFQDDLTRKAVTVALICFFPIVVNTVVAMRNIDRAMLEVALMSGANFWQTLRYVELPLGARAMLGGVKLGATLSVTGAVVGEFVSSDRGLGFLIAYGRGNFDTTLTFVGLVNLALLTLLLYMAASAIERRAVRWDD